MTSIIVKDTTVSSANSTREGMNELGRRLNYAIVTDQPPGSGKYVYKNRAIVWKVLKELHNHANYAVYLQRKAQGSNNTIEMEISPITNRLWKYNDPEQNNREEYLVLEIRKDQTNGRLVEQTVAVPNNRANFELSYLDQFLTDVGVTNIDDEKRQIALAYAMFARCR